LDIITDGEQRRESYSNRFATALEGVDIDNPGTALDRSGHPNPVPRVTGRIRRKFPIVVRDVEFLRANTDRRIKITVPGPFTMAQQAQNDYYEDEQQMVLDYAAAVNAEIKDLFAAGADVVQLDEPYMQARPEKARKYGLRGIEAALNGITGTIAIHICFDMPLSSMFDQETIRSCKSSPDRLCSRFPSKLRNPISTAQYWKSCRERPSSSAPLIFPT
jgi:5-methyltetrahydropteroyltriglutamate--homocysteine methyltransferase